MSEEDRLENIPPEERPTAAAQWANRALNKFEELRTIVDVHEQRIAELEAENERLRDNERLLQRAQRNANQTPDERAIILIKTLHNEAITNRQAGREAAAEMDVREAMKALGGNIRREYMYPTFERAVELVDSDVLEYKKEDRSSSENSRLRLNLKRGELPSVIAGHEIRTLTYEEG